MGVYSCMGCVAPKRHPGCHGQCPEYLADKAKHDAEKAEYIKAKTIEYGLDSQYARGVHRARKKSQKGCR